MPQTKRRRKTKHRGNAAGVVEARGRTGRKPTAAEKRGGVHSGGAGRGAAGSQAARTSRLDKPPTWKGAVLKSMLAAVAMILLGTLLTGKPQQLIALFPIVLVFYIPLSYYTDSFLYKRRQRQKARVAAERERGGAAGKAGAIERNGGAAQGRAAEEGRAASQKAKASAE
jgi:hypothetical protein